MNLYASADFLDAVATVYFGSERARIEDYEVGGKAFRLLTVAGRGPIVKQTFLDLHEPVQALPGKTLRWLPDVSHGLVPMDEFRQDPAWRRFDAAPTTLWQDFPAWGDYLALLRKRRVLSDDLRRRRRLEETAGELECKLDDPGADVLPTTFEWKSAQWRVAGTLDLFAQRQNRDFFHELRSRGLLRASSLRARGRLLATWLGAVFEQRWYGLIFAFNPDPGLAKFSLGRQLLYPMLEESHRAGHAEFDFSIGDEPYKRFFATHVRALAPVGVPPLPTRARSMARQVLRQSPRLYGTLQRAVARMRQAAFSR